MGKYVKPEQSNPRGFAADHTEQSPAMCGKHSGDCFSNHEPMCSGICTERNHMLKNPILPGFHPDPCICRKGDDYYLAVSTFFEWFPGIPIYHSKDLKHWELYTHVLTDDEAVDLKKLPSAKGIWCRA